MSAETLSWMFTIFGIGVLVSAGLTYLWLYIEDWRKKRVKRE